MIMKLKTKFIVLFTWFALFPALMVGTVTKVVTGNEGIKDAEDSARQSLELAQGGTESVLEMVKRINEQASSEVILGMFLEGNELVTADIANARLKQIADTYTVLDNTILTDAQGVVVASDDSSMLGLNCGDLWPDVMSQVMSSNAQVISEGTKNVISGNVMLVMATPVNRGNATKGYFLSAVSVLDVYNKIIAKAHVLDTGYIYVVEPNGTMLMHPDSSLLLGTDSFNNLPVSDIMKTEPSGTGHYDFNGQTKYYTYDTGANGWIYVATLPKAEVESLANFLVKLLMIIVGIIALVAPIVAIIIANGIVKPIINVSNGIKSLADGDFTHVVESKGKDEIGQMAKQLNETTHNLANAVKGVKVTSSSMGDQSDSLAVVSKEMTIAINDLAQAIDTITKGSATQASDMQDTLENLIELEGEIKDIGDNLNAVAGSAVNAQSKAQDGQKTVNELAEAIKDIQSAFDLFRDKIANLGNTVSEISNITDAINAISSQTNLLALNASIEAARAGEMGKGFAVVAGEVGSLAEQSRKSAAEISVLIKNVNVETESVVKDSAHVDKLLEEQSEVIKHVLESFRATLESIQVAEPIIKDTFGSLQVAEKASHMVRERAESVAGVSEEIMASTERLSATSEELLATSEGVADSAEKASHSAELLVQQMGGFICD